MSDTPPIVGDIATSAARIHQIAARLSQLHRAARPCMPADLGTEIFVELCGLTAESHKLQSLKAAAITIGAIPAPPPPVHSFDLELHPANQPLPREPSAEELQSMQRHLQRVGDDHLTAGGAAE